MQLLSNNHFVFKAINALILSAVLPIILLTSSANADEQYHMARTTPNRVPINFLDKNSNPAGFEQDLVDEIAKHANITINVEFLSTLPAAFEAVNANKTDMAMSAISIKPERQKKYDFSEPYFAANPITIISKDPSLKQFSDLKNKVIAVRVGTTHERLVRALMDEYPETQVKPMDTSFLAVQEVVRNKADAALGDDSYMINFAEQYKNYGLVYAIDNTAKEDNYGILFAKDSKLKAKIDQALNQMKDDGSYAKILAKWYPSKGS